MNLAQLKPPPIDVSSLDAAPAEERYDDPAAMLNASSVDLLAGAGRVFLRATADAIVGLVSDDVDTVTEAVATLRRRVQANDGGLILTLFRLFRMNHDDAVRANVVRALFSGDLQDAYHARLKRIMQDALSGSDDLAVVAVAAAAYLRSPLKREFLSIAQSTRRGASGRVSTALKAFAANVR